jgi:hypothetical protein
MAARLVGVLALLQGLRVARARRHSDIEQAALPDPEAIRRMDTPGEDFDDQLLALGSGRGRGTVRKRETVRSRLEDAALTAIAARENCSRERARERLEDGTWTDDPYAAAFFSDRVEHSPSWREWLRRSLRAETPFQRRARRAAAAIADLAGVEVSEP